MRAILLILRVTLFILRENNHCLRAYSSFYLGDVFGSFVICLLLASSLAHGDVEPITTGSLLVIFIISPPNKPWRANGKVKDYGFGRYRESVEHFNERS